MSTFILYLAILLPSGEVDSYKFVGIDSPQECKEIAYTVAKAYVDEGIEGYIKHDCIEGLEI